MGKGLNKDALKDQISRFNREFDFFFSLDHGRKTNTLTICFANSKTFTIVPSSQAPLVHFMFSVDGLK